MKHDRSYALWCLYDYQEKHSLTRSELTRKIVIHAMPDNASKSEIENAVKDNRESIGEAVKRAKQDLAFSEGKEVTSTRRYGNLKNNDKVSTWICDFLFDEHDPYQRNYIAGDAWGT